MVELYRIIEKMDERNTNRQRINYYPLVLNKHINHPLSKEIDWKKFGNDAEELLKSLGKAYYIKKDLRAKM